jgi:hypothetical protein
MKSSTFAWVWSVAVFAALASSGFARQAAPSQNDSEKSEKPSVSKQSDQKLPAVKSPYRPIAPGVLNTIDPMREFKETVSRHKVVELLAVDSKFEWAKEVPFRRDIWTLTFQFKPVRMIWVDMPQPSGRMQRKLIWYLVYSVANTGKVMHPVEDADLPYETFDKRQLYEIKMVEQPVRFTPEFLLEAQVRRPDNSIVTKAYPDRVIPLAFAAIRNREDPKREFLSSVDMCREIKPGETFWGIAAWEDIDPKTFRFSINISGLTSAYRWKDIKGEYKKGDPILKGRRFFRKTLKINFLRSGDPYFEHEEEIRYGVPDGVDYQWVYR